MKTNVHHLLSQRQERPFQYLTAYSLTPDAFDFYGSPEESDALHVCSAHRDAVYWLLTESLSRDRTFRSYTVGYSRIDNVDNS